MSSLREAGAVAWPAALEVFDPADWPPVPGATLQACRCPVCTARFGAALPPDDSTSVKAARRRWREARKTFLREAVGRDHPKYKSEVLCSLREQVS